MKHRIIIVDGQSTVGKSSISKGVYEQIHSQCDAYWLHEECERHPIRHEEFEAGNLHSGEGMQLNREVMLEKWRKFCKEIMESNRICITEGCFLHTLDRYLLESIWEEEETTDYYVQILEILKPLKPLIVFLHRPDIQNSFEKAFAARGEWWKSLILSVPEPYGYFATHKYTGDESIFAGIAFEQEQMANIFDKLDCDKLKIDTSQELWDDYTREITEAAGCEYRAQEKKNTEIEKYCGTYRIEGGEDSWIIQYNTGGQIYSSLFWPYMPMKYVEEKAFELVSFPVRMEFEERLGILQFVVKGNYDWKYNGKRFIKI